MKRMIGLAAISAMGILASCSKETASDPQPVKAKTKTELISAGKWQLTASVEAYVENGINKTDNYFAYMDSCDKDDFMLFSADGMVTSDEGPTKCDASHEQSHAFKWAFYDNETKLILSDTGFADTLNIEVLSETTLTISAEYSFGNMSYTDVQTFGRID